VTFDGSGSSDDRQTPAALAYEWDFGDGSPKATGQTATHSYAAKGVYTATLEVTDADGLADTDTVEITVLGPDLQITNAGASNSKARQGDKVTLTATVYNDGPGKSPATKTEFLQEQGSKVIGLVDTPALAAGQSAQVSVQWRTSDVQGVQRIRITADRPGQVAEENDGNNGGVLTVEVKGNKVSNPSFEQQNEAGTAPASWSPQSTGAGTASSSSSGTDGSQGASMSGNGGNAALFGSPTWTSDPITVMPGETLDFVVSVNAAGVSSPASAGLAYLGAAGQVLDTVKLVTAPLSTSGFTTLEQVVTIPAGVAQVQVVLTGFAPTDLFTRGTVTFDDVGLYAH
jgi:PKD repeat protein